MRKEYIQYNEKVAEEILERLSLGERMTQICVGDDMPKRESVYRWVRKHKKFNDEFCRARTAGFEFLIDRIMDEAEDTQLDRAMKTNKKGEQYEDWDTMHIQRSKLIVDTMKWVIAKAYPKIYGDSSLLKIEDVTDAKLLSDDQLIARIAVLQKKNTDASGTN